MSYSLLSVVCNRGRGGAPPSPSKAAANSDLKLVGLDKFASWSEQVSSMLLHPSAVSPAIKGQLQIVR